MDKKFAIFIITFLVIIGTIGAIIVNNISMNNNSIMVSKSTTTKIKLETTEGNIVIQLYSQMNVTAGNFKTLVEKGFYNGVIFHRIIDGFMIQGGDPTGTGAGGPGYEIKDEFTNTSLDKNNIGTIAMANAGPNTGGSQFFINVADNNFLDGKHPVFGKVIEGMDIVYKIAKAKKDLQDRPLKEVKIIKASVI